MSFPLSEVHECIGDTCSNQNFCIQLIWRVFYCVYNSECLLREAPLHSYTSIHACMRFALIVCMYACSYANMHLRYNSESNVMATWLFT